MKFKVVGWPNTNPMFYFDFMRSDRAGIINTIINYINLTGGVLRYVGGKMQGGT